MKSRFWISLKYSVKLEPYSVTLDQARGFLSSLGDGGAMIIKPLCRPLNIKFNINFNNSAWTTRVGQKLFSVY